MAPKKNKMQKVALSDFLADDKHGSWADEMDSLPTAPAVRAEGERLDTGDFMSRPDRGARGDYAGESRGFAREELPLPTSAPFTAFLGNLSFEVGEPDVEALFTGLTLVSVKIINDHEGKPKGFGYVEFATLDDLKQGLARTGESMGGRTIRISVAEPPKNGSRPSQFGGAADEKSSWRREGPLPPLENTRRPNNNRFDSSGPPADDDRDWSAARGAKFVPSADTGSRFGGPDRREGVNPGAAEAASQWRTGKPLAGAAPGAFGGRDAPPHQRTPRAEAPPSAADLEDQWTRGKNFVASPAMPERQSSFGPRAGAPGPATETSDWRGARKPALDQSPSSSNNASPIPAARRPMSLLPRTGSTAPSSAAPSTTVSPTASSPSSPQLSSSKASPFGAARPIDMSSREKEIEEKRVKAETEKKTLRDQEKAARDLAVKEREEKEKENPKVVLARPIEPKAEPTNWRERPAKGPAPTSQQAQRAVRGSSAAGPSTSVPAKKDEKKKDGSKALSFNALQVEGGDDDEEDEEVEAVREGVEKAQV